MAQRTSPSDRGASLVEYAAVVILAAAVFAGLYSAVSPTFISSSVGAAVDCLTLSEDCGTEPDSGGPGSASGPGEPAPSERPLPAPSELPDGGGPSPKDGAPDPVSDPDGSAPSRSDRVAPNPSAFPDRGGPSPEKSDGDRGDRTNGAVYARPAADDSVPGPGAKPDDVNDWWEGLSEKEQKEVMQEDPDSIRNLDGIPAEVRDELNRDFLTEDIERMLEEEGMTREEVLEYDLQDVRPDHWYQGWGNGAPPLELWEMVKLERTVSAEDSDHYILGLDPDEGDGRAIVSTGNPDTADNVSTLVPGTGIKWTAINGQLSRAENVQQAAEMADEGGDHAVVSWIGYDSPGWGGATNKSSAKAGSDELQDFQAGLRTTHEGPPSNNTLIGHSYGSAVVGETARNNSGAYADNLVLVGSPGVGSDLDELKFDGETEDIHVVMSENDWVADSKGLQTHYFDTQFEQGATQVDTNPQTEHDEYFNDPQTPEMNHIGEVVAGSGRD